MKTILTTLALVLALGPSASFARGRTVRLQTLRNAGVYKLRRGEKSITVRVPRGYELRQGYGGPSGDVTGYLKEKYTKSGSALYKVQPGEFVVNHIGVNTREDRFTIEPDHYPTIKEIHAAQRRAEKKLLAKQALGQ